MSVNRQVVSLDDFRNYLNIAVLNVAFSIYCTASDATAATIQIAGNQVILTITGGNNAGSHILNYDTSNASRTTYNTFGEMADYINALDGWYAYLYGTSSTDVIILANLTATDVLGLNKILFIGTTNSQSKTDSLNSTLSDVINGVTLSIEGFIKRKLDQEEITEYYDGPGGHELILKNFPISTIDSIYIDQNWEWGSTTLVDSDNYTFDPLTGIVIFNGQGIAPTWGAGWTVGRRNLKITYTYGWDDIPDDIRLAGLEIAGMRFLQSHKAEGRLGVVQESEKLGSADSGSRTYLSKAETDYANKTLRRYRRHVFA